MKCILCMVYKFILIFFSNVKHKCLIFRKKESKRASKYIRNGQWLWQGRPSGGGLRQRWSVGPYLALSVFIWHHYSPGNKFWHVKISDNNDIRFNQWRLLSPPRISAQQLGLLIVPKSKPVGFCIIVKAAVARSWVASDGRAALWS